MRDVPPAPTAFYFDLASPLAYLAAERVLHVLGAPAEWQPVLAAELTQGTAIAPADGELSRSELSRRAQALDLQPLRWPEPFPFDSSLAMRVATYAKSIGRTVPFAQAAFRQAFAGGHSLESPDYVLIAAAACEMHPAAVLRGAELRSVAEQLSTTTAAASALGVTEVPAIAVAGTQPGAVALVFQGERALERAAAHVHAHSHGAVAAVKVGER
jgi:2-hydroxychromene-2-carboxylate isomerase